MTDEFDRFAADYDQALNRGLALSGEDKEFYATGRVRWLRRCLIDADLARPRVLDFGCGTGSAIPILHRELDPSQLLGVDVSLESLRVASDQHPSLATFVPMAGLDPGPRIDIAYCNGVFHHIPVEDRPGAMRYVFERLRPGGAFSLWENNPYNPGTRLVMARIPFDRDAVMLPAREARRLATTCGFIVERTDYLFVFPRFLAALRALEPRLSRWPLGGQYQVLLRRPPE